MKFITVSLKLFLPLTLMGFLIQKKSNIKMQERLSQLVENLDNATFSPIRLDEPFDYGFKDGGVINKYEYVRSIFSFEEMQNLIDYPIFLTGPHNKNGLNLNSSYTFGHYNPRFVFDIRDDIRVILSNTYFVKYTKPMLIKFGLVDLLTNYKKVYNITRNRQVEFNEIKTNYINQLKNETWQQGGYRTYLPEIIKTEPYWNWGETCYHFWIIRDIDNTK
jgi:hypothetical protein